MEMEGSRDQSKVESGTDETWKEVRVNRAEVLLVVLV